jgi:hypothetical protein
MKFTISRTSDRGKSQPPCPEAKKESFTWIDERDISNPFANKYLGEKWYEMGRNHRVESNHIKRDIDDDDWFIEIKTFEELAEFISKYGEVIISIPMYYKEGDAKLSIEIYDDYRE